MKKSKKLHQKIILPFIFSCVIFTIIFTLCFIIYISDVLHQKENEIVNQSIQLIETKLNNAFQTNTLISNYLNSNDPIKPQMIPFLIGDTQLNDFEFFSSKTLPKTLKNKIDALDHIKNQTLIHYTTNNRSKSAILLTLPLKNNPQYILYSLNKLLDKIYMPKHLNTGLIHKDTANQTKVFFSKNNTVKIKKSIILTALAKHNKSTKAQKTPIINVNNHTLIIKQSTHFPQLYTFVFLEKNIYRQSLITIIALTMLLIISLSTTFFFIYSMIIKKMTTAIDILSTVSKKVAKGNFEQKIFINRKDEIGLLAQSFNAMISQLKSFTHTITSQKEQLETIITNVPDGIIVTDLDQSIILANKAADHIFNTNFNTLIGQHLHYKIKHTEFKTHQLQLKSKEKFTTEFSLTNKKKTHTYLMTSSLVKNQKEITIGTIYLMRDITREKQIDELQNGFLRTVSHELRTPLTSVIGFIELVIASTKQELDQTKQHYLKTAYDEATHLKTLINDLLDLSQIQAGNTTMFYKNIHLKSFIESIINSLNPLTKSKDIELTYEITDDNLNLMADESKLRRILINLISNSIKFTEKGYIKVNCEQQKNIIQFKVEDTGIGIDENEHELIFEKFRQTKASATKQNEGVGLGLSIVKELVEMHNGSISLDSTSGKGTTFTFTIESKHQKNKHLTKT